MRTSVSRNSSSQTPGRDTPLRGGRLNDGFTLVEILVVLLIITALAGAVVARFPAFARTADLETEVRRLELLLGMARNEAILDSSEYGFRTVGNGYEFLKFADGSQAWEKAPAPFHLRELPEDIELILRTEKNAFNIPGESLPPLLILSSGETTPATLELKSRNNDDARTLESDGYSDFRRAEDE